MEGVGGNRISVNRGLRSKESEKAPVNIFFFFLVKKLSSERDYLFIYSSNRIVGGLLGIRHCTSC